METRTYKATRTNVTTWNIHFRMNGYEMETGELFTGTDRDAKMTMIDSADDFELISVEEIITVEVVPVCPHDHEVNLQDAAAFDLRLVPEFVDSVCGMLA